MNIIKQLWYKLLGNDMLPQEICVEIPPQKDYNLGVYQDNSDCYLVKALKKLGYDNIHVYGWGETWINGTHYEPLENFDNGIMMMNSHNNKITKLTLIRQ